MVIRVKPLIQFNSPKGQLTKRTPLPSLAPTTPPTPPQKKKKGKSIVASKNYISQSQITTLRLAWVLTIHHHRIWYMFQAYARIVLNLASFISNSDVSFKFNLKFWVDYTSLWNSGLLLHISLRER